MRVASSIRIVVVLACLAIPASAQVHIAKKDFRLPRVPEPANNKMTPARVRLGKMLFFDPRLSGSNWISCATCHNPTMNWSDGLPTALGQGMKTLRRETPSIVNSGFNRLQMWDGRFHSLEEQAAGPMLSADEMNAQMDQTVAKLESIPDYLTAFEKAYPGEGITRETIGKAIACFERTIVSRESPFDHWVNGSENAINADAKQGFKLFVGKANCVACHQPPNFTDDGFHNIGLTDNHDEGRYAIVPIKVTKGGFKTPSLRNVAMSTPYMHDGEYQTLEDVIDHYDRGGDDKQNLDPNMKPLHLTDREKKDLVQFLKSLTSKPSAITLPVLPRGETPNPKEKP